MKLSSPATTIGCRQSLIVPTSKMAKINVMDMNSSIQNDNEKRSSSKKSSSEVIEVNFCYTALISMCLGFLFIWSSVISLIFIANKIDETRFMQKPLEIFIEQEQIGRIMFSVGQEMLFTVDSLVSIHLNLSDPQELSKSVNFTWDLTDDDIEDVKAQIDENSNNNNNNDDLAKMIDSFETKLDSIRSNLSLATDHPLTMINSYKLIFDIAEQYSIERKLYQTPMKHDSQWHLIKSFSQIQNSPYALFIKGMDRRFIELAYGTIYHIGPQLLNRSDAETEVANYFYYFYSSHELIENAFAWDSRIYHRYMELIRSKQYRSLQSSITNQSNYRLSGREYTRFVTDVVAYLLRAKDVLNVGLKEILIEITDRNTTQFYAIISCIYLFVLILCSTFFILFIRNAKIKDESTMNNCLTTMINNDNHRFLCNNNDDSEINDCLVDNQQQQQQQYGQCHQQSEQSSSSSQINRQISLDQLQQQQQQPYYGYIDTISGQIDYHNHHHQLLSKRLSK
nr:uncharacterized protein LOC124498042 [Dermatophagoides farinae]